MSESFPTNWERPNLSGKVKNYKLRKSPSKSPKVPVEQWGSVSYHAISSHKCATLGASTSSVSQSVNANSTPLHSWVFETQSSKSRTKAVVKKTSSAATKFLIQPRSSLSHSWVQSTVGASSSIVTIDSNLATAPQSDEIPLHTTHSWVFRTQRSMMQTPKPKSYKDAYRFRYVKLPPADLPFDDIGRTLSKTLERKQKQKEFSLHNGFETQTGEDSLDTDTITDLPTAEEQRRKRLDNWRHKRRRKLNRLLDESKVWQAIPSSSTYRDVGYASSYASEDDDKVAEFREQYFEEEYARNLELKNKKSTLQDFEEVSMGRRPISSASSRPVARVPSIINRPISAPAREDLPYPFKIIKRDVYRFSTKELSHMNRPLRQMTYLFPDMMDMPDPGKDLSGGYFPAVPVLPIRKKYSHKEGDGGMSGCKRYESRVDDTYLKSSEPSRFSYNPYGVEHQLSPSGTRRRPGIFSSSNSIFNKDSPWISWKSQGATKSKPSSPPPVKKTTVHKPWAPCFTVQKCNLVLPRTKIEECFRSHCNDSPLHPHSRPMSAPLQNFLDVRETLEFSTHKRKKKRLPRKIVNSSLIRKEIFDLRDVEGSEDERFKMKEAIGRHMFRCTEDFRRDF